MAIEEDITQALNQRAARSAAQAPTLAEIRDAADADVRLVPDDGRPGAGNPGARQRLLVAAAAAVVLVLVIGGVVVFTGDGGEDGAPVVAGPVPGEEVTWRDAPLLAPADTDWYVNQWSPNLPGPEVSPARVPVWFSTFQAGGVHWSLSAQYVAGDPGDPFVAPDWEQAKSEQVVVGGREVKIVRQPETLDPSASPVPPEAAATMPGSVSALWSEGSFEVVLFTGVGGIVGPGGTDVSSTLPPAAGLHTFDELLRDVLASIQPVSLDRWSAALQPGEGVPAPDLSSDSGDGGSSAPFAPGDTNRPLRIGAPPDLASSELSVEPWVSSWTTLTQRSSGEPLSLEVFNTTAGSSGAEQLAVGGSSPGEPVTVRGVDGQRFTHAEGTREVPLSRGDESRTAVKGLTWPEGGSQVSLLYPAEISDDDALEIANALVILDDAAWEALLFPGRGDAASSTTTASSTDPIPLPPLTVLEQYQSSPCQLADPPAMVVLLAPDVTDEERAAVGDEIESWDAVDRVVVVEAPAAHAELVDAFGPDTGVLAEEMPISFRVWGTAGWPPDGPTDIADLPGVIGTVACN